MATVELMVKDTEGFPREQGDFPINTEGPGGHATNHLEEEEAAVFQLARSGSIREICQRSANGFLKPKINCLPYIYRK